jgi:hypothetical protein
VSVGNFPSSFFWRAISALFRRTGNTFHRVAGEAYNRSLPQISKEQRLLIRANERFRNCHIGQRCFVIGNGPSLQRQDLSLLANETTFVMNGFCKHPSVGEWQPTYYFFSDPVLFDGSDSAGEFFAEVRSRIHKTTFFVPVHYKKIIDEKAILPSGSTSFFAYGHTILGEDSENGVDFTRMVPTSETVAQTAIMAAIYMGCSPIYLLGLDHDWLAHHGETRGYNFYSGLILKNHPGVTGKLGDYGKQIESLLRVWKSYYSLKEIVERKGIRILNATHGGFLDVFDRVSYESLFSRE